MARLVQATFHTLILTESEAEDLMAIVGRVARNDTAYNIYGMLEDASVIESEGFYGDIEFDRSSRCRDGEDFS